MVFIKTKLESKVVEMGNDETYNAVKAIFTMFGNFVRDVADEIGWEKTTEIYSKMGERDESETTQFLKKQKKDKRLDELAKMQSEFYNASGWKVEYEVTPETLEYTVHRCPCFDGFSDAGLEKEKINMLCKATHIVVNKRLKTHLPGAKYTSVVKPSKDEPCKEKYTIPI